MFLIKTSVFTQINILTMGANPDGRTLNTAIIQKAIDSCAARGGGKVIIPKGRFLTGSVWLKSGVNLHVTEGGVLLGSPCREDYQKHEWYALILAFNQKNIAITGKGIIDGQGRALAADVERLWHEGVFVNVKKEKRPDEKQRPEIIEMTDCQRVRIEDITIKNAACWVQTYHNCSDMTIRRVKVESMAYWNNDGIDLVDCKRVRMRDCFINSADDGICLKSHNTKTYCDDIRIERCTVRSSASAFKMGTASYGGFKRIRVNRLYIYDTYRSAIAIESVDGGVIEDINISNITARNTGNALFIRLGKRLSFRPVGRIEGIFIKNLDVEIPKDKPDKNYDVAGPAADSVSNILPSSIVGLQGYNVKKVQLQNVTIRHPGGGTPQVAYRPADDLTKVPEHPAEYPEFSMFGELPAWGFFLRHTEGVRFKNVKLILKEKDYRPAVVSNHTPQSGNDLSVKVSSQ